MQSRQARSVPERLFDAHARLMQTGARMLPPSASGLSAAEPQEFTREDWHNHIERHVGAERLCGALFSPAYFESTEQIASLNAYILREASDSGDSRALALVLPDMAEADMSPFLGNASFAGFMPYSLATSAAESAARSAVRAAIDLSPEGQIPEWIWSVANERGFLISLPLESSGARAASGNRWYLLRHCERYPAAEVLLTRCGRAFRGPNPGEGVAMLRDVPNLHFDTAGIRDAGTVRAMLEAFGPQRLLWGSGSPVSAKCDCGAGTVGTAAILAAADDLGLGAVDLKDIFSDNAMRLLGLLAEDGLRTESLYRHARERIPGGTQLLSKRPEMLAPGQWPAYFREARGCETWDLDGHHYYDFSTNGIGSCLLGFRDPDVTRAVHRRIELGSMCSLNPPEEVELADLLCEIHPWAEQVRFARCGGEACAMAVRIARSTTDRSFVAICGYSGWQDWYLAANLGNDDSLRGHLLPGLAPLGVPRELRGTTVAFSFNDREAFQSIIDRYGDRLAAVVMEPCRSCDPDPGFLEFIRDGTHRAGALLLFDEITIGWRLRFGGAHLGFNVAPDIAVFAKAMGNGHPMAAVIGTRAAMAGAHGSFISSTYWTESVGPVAALATLRKMSEIDVPAHIAGVGARVHHCWEESARRHGLPVVVEEGYPCLSHFRFDHPESGELRTLFTQLMLEEGFLAGTGLYPTLAHSDAVVDRYCASVERVFSHIAGMLSADGRVGDRLRGPVAHDGFRRLTK